MDPLTTAQFEGGCLANFRFSPAASEALDDGDGDGLVYFVEADSNEAIARISAQFGSRGTLEVTTLAAITMQDYVRELEMAKIIDKGS